MRNVFEAALAGLRWIGAMFREEQDPTPLECHMSRDEQLDRLPLLKTVYREHPELGLLAIETRGFKGDRYGDGRRIFTRTRVVGRAR